jgi:FkbM family methyltransferase
LAVTTEQRYLSSKNPAAREAKWGIGMLMTVAKWIERAVSGTPVEGVARRTWSEVSSIGRPRARQSRRYDRQTLEIMKRTLRNGSNCIDVGCHRGVMLAPMCELASEGLHFAFEPLPTLCDDLRKRFPKVHIHQAALSDEHGSATFCHVVDNPGLSGFRRMGKVPVGARVEEITVRTERLDDVIPRELTIDFMKVDVEGAQLQVFRGAMRTITKNRPFIIFEHGILAQQSYNTTSDMIYDLLVESCGLKISLLTDWLSKRLPLDRASFSSHVGFHQESHFCFLAHPY